MWFQEIRIWAAARRWGEVAQFFLCQVTCRTCEEATFLLVGWLQIVGSDFGRLSRVVQVAESRLADQSGRWNSWNIVALPNKKLPSSSSDRRMRQAGEALQAYIQRLKVDTYAAYLHNKVTRVNVTFVTSETVNLRYFIKFHTGIFSGHFLSKWIH